MSPKRKGKTSWRHVISARQLRQEETEAEKVLWNALLGKRLNGLKFRRQHPYENTILDFFCVERQLVVELDGSVHDLPDQSATDEERTKFLNDHGLRVIRFRNEDILKNLPDVYKRLLKLPPIPAPSPEHALWSGEGGGWGRYVSSYHIQRRGLGWQKDSAV
jgi:5-methyltetrahydrofolate--homocysteine methyltransferase